MGIIQQQSMKGGKGCLNMYNAALRDRSAKDKCGLNWPYELAWLQSYLSSSDVRKSLHVTAKKWTECTHPKLDQTTMAAGVTKIAELAKRMKIFVVGMANDYISHTDGLAKSLDQLTWLGENGFGVRHLWDGSILTSSGKTP